MHYNETYAGKFNGKPYDVLMTQHQENGPWTIAIQLRDENDRPVGRRWHDADNTYATKAAAQAAGSTWAEAQLA